MGGTTTMDALARAQPPLGPRLRVARENAGLSVEECARRVGVEPTSLRAWEAGERAPRANRLQVLAGVLNVNLGWLLIGREDRYMASENDDEATLRERIRRARERIAEGMKLLEEAESALDARRDRSGEER